MSQLKSFKEVAFRDAMKNKRNTVSLIIALVLSISMITSILLLQKNNKEKTVSEIQKNTGNYNVRVQNLDKDKIDKLENSNKVSNYVLGVSQGAINLQHVDKNMDLLEVYSLEKRAYEEVFYFNLIDGRLPENENEVLVQGNLSKKMGQYYKVGDQITLELEVNRSREKYNRYSALAKYNKEILGPVGKEYTGDVLNSEFGALEKEKRVYKVVGVVDTGNDNKLWGDRFLTVLNDNDSIFKNNYEAFVNLNKSGDEDALAEELGVKYYPVLPGQSEYGVLASDIKYSGQEKLISAANTGVIVGLVLITLFCLIAIRNIFGVSLQQKLKQYGILRAIGATMGQITYLIASETVVIFLISLPIGIGFGLLTVEGQFKILNNMFNLNYEFTTILTLVDYLLITLISIFIIAISMYKLIRRSNSLTPIQAITGVKKQKRRGLSIISLDSMSSKKELESEEAIEDGEELFADVLSHNKKTLKYKLMTKLFKFEGALAHQNITRDAETNRVSIIALTITTMALLAFFFQYVNGSIGAKNLIMSSHWDVSATNDIWGYDENDIEKILKINGVEAVYKDEEASVQSILMKNDLSQELLNVLEKSPRTITDNDRYLTTARLRALDDKSYEVYSEYILQGSLDKELLDNNGVILVSKNTNVIMQGVDNIYVDSDPTLNIKVGDDIPIVNGTYVMDKNELTKLDNNENILKLKVVGIISEDAFLNSINTRDTNNLTTNFTMITSEDTFGKITNINKPNRLLIKTSDTDRAETINKLDKEVGVSYGRISDQITLADKSKRDTIINLSYSIILGITIVLLSMLNLIVTITANILSRKKEMAALSAIGMSQKQKKKMIIAECFNVGLTGSMAAGISIGFIGFISQFVNARAGTVSILFVGGIVLLILIVMSLFSTLVSIAPLRALKNMNIVDTLKEEL